MERNRVLLSLIVPILITPAFMAFFYARYLIENHFPDLHLIDLGAFYLMGLISGFSTGLVLLMIRKKEVPK